MWRLSEDDSGIFQDIFRNHFGLENSLESLFEPQNRDRFVCYFIFICYLLGNDFLPHLPALDIYGSGLDILLEKYMELIGNYGYKKLKIGEIFLFAC